MVAVALTAVICWLAALAVVATWPVTRPPLSGLSFTVGFLVIELAGQLVVASLAVTAALAALGWPTGPLGVVAAVAAAAALGLFGSMLAAGLRSRHVVAAALGHARVGADPGEGPPRGAWLSWWRTAIAVPLGRGEVVVHRDLAYVDDGDEAHRLDVYVPPGDPRGAPVLLFVHGGAWVFGSKRGQGLPLLKELAARGWVCVTCNYRLSPSATWPDHIVDVKRAIAWTRANAARFGGDPARFLAVVGNSAGGHLAALSALAPNEAAWQPGFEGADTRVDACVSLYGVLEMTGDAELAGRQGRATVVLLERTVMKAPLAQAREVYEAASPLHRLGADAPPFLVLHGTRDSLVPVAVARAFVAACREVSRSPVAYVELSGAQHAFDLVCSPRCTAVVRGIATFLDALVARKDAAATPARP